MPDVFLPPSSSRARRPRRRWPRALATAVLAVVVLAAAAAGLALSERHTIPAGTTIGDVDVGGMTRAEATEAIVPEARERVARTIRLIGPRGVETVTGTALGSRPLLDPALDEALDAGPAERLLAHVGIGSPTRIPLLYRIGPVRAARLANRLDRRFGEQPRDAGIAVRGGTVSLVAPAPGLLVDRGALRRSLRELPAEVGVRLRPQAPAIGPAEAREAQRDVERLLDAPREVRHEGASAVLAPATLGALVETEPSGGRLEVRLDPAGLREALLPRLGRFERDPQAARFVVEGSRVRIVPSVPGRRLDAERTAGFLLSNLAARVQRARFETVQPELTTERARKLGVRELVSEFTTYYPCCAPRVTNIKRAAELLDGRLILPGKAFSLNDALGKRTEAKGFVSAPQIFNGRFEDAVGGGISQVATTLYNAAFFAGIELVTHQAHQYYISRYPMGREATVSWGGPELVFRNDWPAAILMKLSATDTGIAVRFYSSKLGRRVTTTTGEPYAFKEPRTIVVTNPDLPPGAREVVQEAGDRGFTVDFTRQVFRNGKRIRNEHYKQRYDAENEIVEVGPPR